MLSPISTVFGYTSGLGVCRTLHCSHIHSSPKLGSHFSRILSAIVLLLNNSCVTPAPTPTDYYSQLPPTHTRLQLDLELLATAKLPEEKKQVAQELLIFFHTSESALTEYIGALEKNLETNEQLSENYSVFHAWLGALAGLSSPAILLSTAAVAAPATAAVCVLGAMTYNRFNVEPVLKDDRKRLEEARALAQLFPDIQRAFDIAMLVGSQPQAERRFQKWEAYVEGLKAKVLPFFGRPVD